jgi:hypothetical protein
MAGAGDYDGSMLTSEDRLAIEELNARYLIAFDLRVLTKVAAAFAPTGVFEHWTGVRAEGREAIEAFMAQRMAESDRDYSIVQHSVRNLVVQGDGERATSFCYLVRMAQLHDGGFEAKLGYYSDRLVKHEGKWLFDTRAVSFARPDHNMVPL